MKECRCCKRMIQEEEMICSFCGYDFKTDTINPEFKAKKELEEKTGKKSKIKERQEYGQRRGVSPAVKRFALIGLAIVIFSIFYKYNFNLGGVMSEVKQLLSQVRIKMSKFIPLTVEKEDKKKKKAGEQIEKPQLIELRSYEAPKKTIPAGEFVVEGIFFDPQGKSFATINGVVVGEGDSVDKAWVKKINAHSVELIVDGKKKIIGVK